MRTNATDNLEVKAKDVYDGMLKSLTDKGHQLTDISRAGLNSFIRTRNGINKVMTKSRSKLPRQLSDIDFNKQDFLQYTINYNKRLPPTTKAYIVNLFRMNITNPSQILSIIQKENLPSLSKLQIYSLLQDLKKRSK